MSSVFVQAVAKQSAGTTLSYTTFDIAVTAGNKLYLSLVMPQTTDKITSVVINGSSAAQTTTWTKAKSVNGSTVSSGSHSIWTATVTVGGSLFVDVTASASGIASVLCEFSSAGVTIDNSGSYAGGSSNTNITSATPFTSTNSTDIWLATFSTHDTYTSFTPMNLASPNDNWQQAAIGNGATSGIAMSVDYKIVSATVSGATMGGVVTGSTITNYTGSLVAFKQTDPIVASSFLIGATP
jgi:hypothetical protein